MQGSSCELVLKGGTIKDCTAAKGGGIYLNNGAPMKIGGNFEETVGTTKTQVRHQLVFSGNYGTDYASQSGKANGTDKTAYNGGKARQDIFVTNLTGNPAQSIKVMGAIQTYPDGTTDEEAMKLYRGTIWLCIPAPIVS